MPDSIKLIVGTEPVKRIAIVSKGRSPSVAVVYATRDGDLEVLDGGKPMRWSDSMFTRYRTRYEVDISDHDLTFRFDKQPLPTQDDIYFFHAEVSVKFRVTSPAEVIRRNVSDAAQLVRGHLLSACRPITRMYSIEEAEAAEAAIHARFRRDTQIYGGITIHAVGARLSLDEAGRAWLQEIQKVRRDEQVRTEQHATDVRDVHRENEIKELRQGGEHNLQDRERIRHSSRPLDGQAIIAMHLERHPHDTIGAAKLAADWEAAQLSERIRQDEQARAVWNSLVENGHVQHTDVQALLDGTLARLTASSETFRTTATVQPPQPQPPASAAIGWDTPLSGPVRAQPAPEPRKPANVLPVYLIVDESPAAAGWVDQLSDAVQDVCTAIAEDARTGSAIRLGVLGFAETVSVRMPLGEVADGQKAEPLLTRGPAGHAGLFRWLAEHVPDEVEDLRAHNSSVRGPLIVLLTAAAAGADDWTAARRQLARRLRRADLIAVGVGEAEADDIAGFASLPELGFVAEDGSDAAITEFSDFLREHVLGCGRAARDGTEAPQALPPTGFRSTEDGV